MVINILHRKEMVVYTAIDVIDEYGIQGVSTKEIAKRQGIAESTIYKHFKTKNDIILAVLDHYSQFDEDIIVSAREQSDSPIEALMLFMKVYAEYYENYPAITVITQSYDVLQYNPELVERVRTIIRTREMFTKAQIDEAKTKNLIDPEVDSGDLTDILLGTFMRLCLKWRMEGQNFSLKTKILTNVQMILKVFQV